MRVIGVGCYLPYAVANHHRPVFQHMSFVDRWFCHTMGALYFTLNCIWCVRIV